MLHQHLGCQILSKKGRCGFALAQQ
uniref:Uncharacterized protein n=1 Tax=Anguilla anguilla TaxID=7936 RepID=A0A0E9VF89_ANGAN